MKVICDTCANYYVHPSGTRETCDAKMIASNRMDNGYISERMGGNKKNCKCYDELQGEVNIWI